MYIERVILSLAYSPIAKVVRLDDWVVDTIMPRLCPGCNGTLTRSESRATHRLCKACESELGALPKPLARKIDQLLVIPAFPFTTTVKRFIGTAKYRPSANAAKTLARLAAARITLELNAINPAVVVPIPLGKKRLRQRGFNQIDAFAAELAKRSHGAVCHWLRRCRDTTPQVGKTRQERLLNPAGSFVWLGSREKLQTVILVDDVVTTGATLNAAYDAIRSARGAHRIIAIVVASASLAGDKSVDQSLGGDHDLSPLAVKTLDFG